MASNHGCHNRPAYKPAMVVQDGYWSDGETRTAKLVSVPFRMAKDCQYTQSALGQKDQSCEGCKWRNEVKG